MDTRVAVISIIVEDSDSIETLNQLLYDARDYKMCIRDRKSNIPIVGEIPRSDEIIRWEDQGKTVIEGDAGSEISRRFFDLAEMLLKAEEEE